MPSKIKTTKVQKQAKRHGLHHKHSKPYKQVYWPFIPLLSIVIMVGLSVGILRNTRTSQVLGYASNISHASLLEATNQARRSNDRPELVLDDSLSQAAQAKAEDMVSRDYWSHQTPEGSDPWVFIEEAGYKYRKAGENLAYGFSNPTSTVSGWMNSQAHRDNLLDSAFTQVGFGFVNANDFQSSGQETVIVALYAQPLVAAAQTLDQGAQQLDATTDLESKNISRIEALVGSQASWSVLAIGIITGGAVTGLIISQGLRIRKIIRKSEKFIVAHPLLDVLLIGITLIGYELTRTVGFIH